MGHFFAILTCNHRKTSLLLVPILAGLVMIPSCKRQNQKVEKPVEVKAQTPLGVQPVIQPVYAKLPAPTPNEIKEALDRVFQGAGIADDKENPRYIVGDFNGDSSEDLAIWVKPLPERLAELNDEFANWTLVDPQDASSGWQNASRPYAGAKSEAGEDPDFRAAASRDSRSLRQRLARS